MAHLKLSYFDFHGGRGEPARLALSLAGIAYEDDRIPPAQWRERKADTPFGSLPVLEVDGKRVTQSNAINRYVGKLAKLYPEDAFEAAVCDEIMDAIEDVSHKLGATFSISDKEELKAQRQKLVDGPLTFYLERVERRLKEQGGEYFADGRLTMADLKCFVWIRHLKAGVLDHVPNDLADRIAPQLVAHHDRMKNDPRIKAYYAGFAKQQSS